MCDFSMYKGDPSDIETFQLFDRYHKSKNIIQIINIFILHIQSQILMYLETSQCHSDLLYT